MLPSKSSILPSIRAAAVLALLASAARLLGQESSDSVRLGAVSFPNSGAPAAQAYFIRGVAALHSFWYEEAIESFRASTRLDPHFALGYWGEALSFDELIWGQEDLAAGRLALAQISDADPVTPREKAYIDSARALYGPGSRTERLQAYTAALGRVHDAYPDDLEAEAFYAVALITVGHPLPGAGAETEEGLAARLHGGALALDVYQRNPNHPGAAHYIIHAFDDPEHAILALAAARRYAQIAPEAFHAEHMPSHIFLQLGYWPEAARSNEVSWADSDAWARRRNFPLSVRDYHSHHWLTYIYLQEGRFDRARALVDELRDTIAAHGTRSVNNYDISVADYIIESQRWDQADALAAEPASRFQGSGGGINEVCDPTQPVGHPATALSPDGRRDAQLALYVRTYAAIGRGDPAAAGLLAALQALPVPPTPSAQTIWKIRELEVTALSRAAGGDLPGALAAAQQAAGLEKQTGKPSGPSLLVKPAYELYGEILLRAGRPRDALAQFRVALGRQANRPRSVLGAARAAAQLGDRPAALAAYGQFLADWSQADLSLPELREAHAYVGAGAPAVSVTRN